MTSRKYISVFGAREHNLSIDRVDIPLSALTVITGVSGSGKSSLIYDTLYHEAMRRFISSLSPFARQKIRKADRPSVEKIVGLPAAVSVGQRYGGGSPRSTVGTLSGLYDILRLLFARFGKSDVEGNLSRSLFSFNSPEGACPVCRGLGVEDVIDPELLIADEHKSLREGALKITLPNGYTIYSQVTIDALNTVCEAHGFSVDIPWNQLTEEQKEVIWNGSDRVKIPFGKHTLESRMKWKGIKAQPRELKFYRGILPIMNAILQKDRNKNILRFARTDTCRACGGSRLNDFARSVRWRGRTIAELSALTIAELIQFFEHIEEGPCTDITAPFLHIARSLNETGVGYLALDRVSTTLSGGEIQRIRMVRLHSGLSRVLFIVDEPSTGLHPIERERLMQSFRRLTESGNTVVLVDHSPETMKAADFLIDIGPGAGKNGGRIVYAGHPEDIPVDSGETGQLLHSSLAVNESPRVTSLYTAYGSLHNLHDISASCARGAVTVITGVSGAGKTSLLHLFRKSMEEDKEKHLFITHAPIGRTVRSNPATYTGLFDKIRRLFATLPEAKKRGLTASSFSFNTAGERCEQCEGAGVVTLGMHFMGRETVVCDLCEGKRFSNTIRKVTLREKSIVDVLDMSVDEALMFFHNEKSLLPPLVALSRCGLGYCLLGQSSSTLSGGEAQRVKLAAALAKGGSNTFFLMDEPLRGLHPSDAKRLFDYFSELTQKGASFVMVAHEPFVIAKADRIIDVGPRAGREGGRILFQGTPREFIRHNTPTATVLRTLLSARPDSRKKVSVDNAPGAIRLSGVTTHNLKHISVSFPHNKWSLIAGPSGSGKSSLLLDTLYATAHNRYLDTFSSFERERIGLLEEGELSSAEGVTPAIAISGKIRRPSPRSTVGSVTTAFDYYRLLFARFAGYPFTASHFSPNRKTGACLACDGSGTKMVCSPERLITDVRLPLFAGAMGGTKTGRSYGEPHGRYAAIVTAVFDEASCSLETPWYAVPEELRHAVLFGTGEKEYSVVWHFRRGGRTGTESFVSSWAGFVPLIEQEYALRAGNSRAKVLEEVMIPRPCDQCGGSGLNQRALSVTMAGISIAELAGKNAREALAFFDRHPDVATSRYGDRILPEVCSILQAVVRAGLGHIALSRRTDTLSNGEMTRLRLVSAVASESEGITYLIDEPSDGLHPSEIPDIIRLLKGIALRNTLITVDHSPQLRAAADYLVELGPGAGSAGGTVVYSGKPRLHDTQVNLPQKKRFPEEQQIIRCVDVAVRTLKKREIVVRSHAVTAVVGRSGSGKTTLLFDVLAPSFKRQQAIGCRSMERSDLISSIVESNRRFSLPPSFVSSFVGVSKEVRKLLVRGSSFTVSSLSRHSKKGACPVCGGSGFEKIAVDFLPESRRVCERCGGSGYNDEALQLIYRGKNCADIDQLSIEEAASFFEDHSFSQRFSLLIDAGLGHIPLGMSVAELSHGEQIRISLVRHLLEAQEATLFLLDEPTAGQQDDEVALLYRLFDRLRENGSAVVVATHHPFLMEAADYTIYTGDDDA